MSALPLPFWQRERPTIAVDEFNRTRDLRAAPLYDDLHLEILRRNQARAVAAAADDEALGREIAAQALCRVPRAASSER